MKYLFWDIDGTLLLTGGAGSYALEQAVRSYYGLREFSFTASLAGRTNAAIIKEAMLRLTGAYDPAAAATIMDLCAEELQIALPRYRGRVMQNVERTLRYFAALPGSYANCLLTGNDAKSSALKLAYYGLEQYFDFPRSVFGEVLAERSDLAREALRRLRRENPAASARDCIFIGDTPNDAACAAAINARCLIVLDGSSSTAAAFATAPPWQILAALPADPAELRQLFEANEKVKL